MIYYPVSVLMLAASARSSSSRPLSTSTTTSACSAPRAVRPVVLLRRPAPPEGLAQAFVIGRDFVGDDSVALILGDNLFFGAGMADLLKRAVARTDGATVFAYHVENPQAYGVVSLDAAGKATKIVEKPENPESTWAVTGLYFYDNAVLDIAAAVKPSARGELEITSVNEAYLQRGQLYVERMSRATHGSTPARTTACWRPPSSCARSSTGRAPVACLEEIAYLQGFIDRDQLVARGQLFSKTAYGKNLLRLATEVDLLGLL